ncbi:uncharacterized protein HKW66_Vig0064050 [Vigna angularis]|uniref:Golgi apparatus membrane protein TVP15 n=2 Tax=Phaseolus angularis TaxID=3914 RepID=A0A8T0KAD2_PHAAN|nr:uncharacterized protein LOC108342437 [Vigna angularis]KAG2396219.1 uncharacterized protein HKW66_Vig0064050 [Vigna angularis]BAT86914.1 hypothetical protein VIGAN_05024600 [Vigna angularis var. angularis]
MRREGEGERENVPQLTASSSRRRLRKRFRPDPFLSLCRCFSFLVILSSIFCIAVNVLSAIRSFKNQSDIFDGIFRCYAVFIACFGVLAETEWSFIVKFWKVIEYWVARGMLHIFVAVMTRAFPDYSGEKKELIVLQSIACYMLLACGVIYVVSGILCIGFLKRVRQKQEISREQAEKDLEELERRREELEQLLITQ